MYYEKIPRFNFCVRKNETFTDTLVFFNKDGTKVDFSGYDEILLEIRDTPSVDGTLLYTMSTGNGKITRPALGTLGFNIPATDCMEFNFTDDKAYFDLSARSGSTIKVLGQGDFKTEQGVTNPADFS